MIANLAFTTPLLLVALLALPVLWWLLRAVPPAPIRGGFPAWRCCWVSRTTTARPTRRRGGFCSCACWRRRRDRGFRGPVLNPQTERAGDGPLLIVMDASWASARDWSDRTERVSALLDEAGARRGPWRSLH
jgi:hypothetical protein